jgi:hypothetical protein
MHFLTSALDGREWSVSRSYRFIPREMTPVLTTHLHLILPSHISQVLLSGLFPSGFPTKIIYAFPTSPIRATCPIHRRSSVMNYTSMQSNFTEINACWFLIYRRIPHQPCYVLFPASVL